MDERRLFLAVALSLLVIILYPRFMPKGTAPPEGAPAAATPGPEPSKPVVETQGQRQAPVSQEQEAAGRPMVASRIAASEERRVELATANAVIAFTNRGARVVSWKLTRIKDHEGHPEEMVGKADAVRPLDLTSGDAAVDARIRDALFRPSSESVDSRSRPQTLTFEYAEDDLAVRKELRGLSDGLVEVNVSVRRNGREVEKRLVWGPGLGSPSEEEKSVRGYQPPAAVSLSGRRVTRDAVKSLRKKRTELDGVTWLGIESNYFAALLLSPHPESGEAWAVQEGGSDDWSAVVGLDLGRGTGPVEVFVGAKDYFRLRSLGHGLKEVVPVGEWIGPIVVPLLGLLRWVHKSVGNYGWSIVLLTVVINLAMAPFRHFSIVNGLKMARMAPEMKVIQERYRKIPMLDPRRQQMQKEMGELYQKHGMSMGSQMAVGCLPLLLTMPFLFAFYRVLQVSVELRGAPFLWIPDLSSKDPLFLTPILMGASMILMQKLTPSSMDPTQQRMMMIMPIVFVVMFFAAPAGLNLYWLAANVCSIFQQLVTMRLAKGAGLAPAARKARRA